MRVVPRRNRDPSHAGPLWSGSEAVDLSFTAFGTDDETTFTDSRRRGHGTTELCLPALYAVVETHFVNIPVVRADKDSILANNDR